MTQDEFNNAIAGKKPSDYMVQQQAPAEAQQLPEAPSIDEYLAILQLLRRPKLSVTTAPTFIPQKFADQIQFYDDGATRRLYIYVNKVWRYTTLT